MSEILFLKKILLSARMAKSSGKEVFSVKDYKDNKKKIAKLLTKQSGVK